METREKARIEMNTQSHGGTACRSFLLQGLTALLGRISQPNWPTDFRSWDSPSTIRYQFPAAIRMFVRHKTRNRSEDGSQRNSPIGLSIVAPRRNRRGASKAGTIQEPTPFKQLGNGRMPLGPPVVN